jgi:SpoVK/Ycf46/Vps4 family AAA+-type ATPase
LPAAVILCTNRLSAIDPAVQRRAAGIYEFHRPDAQQRRAVLEAPLGEIGLSAAEIDKIVAATGSERAKPGFTFSDLTQRLIPTLVLDAYPDRAITASRALKLAREIRPTPPFKDGK